MLLMTDSLLANVGQLGWEVPGLPLPSPSVYVCVYVCVWGGRLRGGGCAAALREWPAGGWWGGGGGDGELVVNAVQYIY